MVTPVKVDVWSDIACPWCFIGKRRFEQAVARFEGEVEVEFHSFELSPDTPVGYAGSTTEFLARHKGMAPAQVEQMLAQVTGIAEGEGLHYDFDAVRHTNTVLAHQALHHAKAHGRQAELKERLLAAYFEQGRDLGQVDVVVELGAEVGLDADALRRDLEAGTYVDAVRADEAQAASYGINGVPFYVLDGRYGVSGAQSPETFLSALQQVETDRAAARA
ncbi:DsbA family oxidoreductase [Lapillicoccus jejuensis]|uniref:Putative DsbA family dithiol-disulfide isomerase n=1 Tax=Lapillicoccus jejuensis TaxID=402171 RepID=A0A542E1D0_9MICO|nr:DsbA family oxidoreductase [Lapillicoccus jejuensis]TQJ09014.1 putative DsbA family dithiol-disulfide isomerase [Lapillicoccus jejuensis]